MNAIQDLRLWRLRIPLKLTFKHASAERAVTESVWAEAKGEAGVTGYGEACPRSYVTGETPASCGVFLEGVRAELCRSVQSAADLAFWADRRRTEIDENPAAWCAIELAILDLFARQHGSTAEAMLGLPPLAGVFHYTAILGDQDESSFAAQLRQYREWGFCSFKVKLSREAAANRAKARLLGEAGLGRDQVRADANNLWPSAAEAIAGMEPVASAFHAVEEPVAAGDFDGMRAIHRVLETRLILDESFLRAGHFQQIERDPERWIVNVRVSKMGGLRRSLEIVRLAAVKGIPVIVGAQVGETSVLTRAGLTVAHAARPILAAQEGAFGTHLLTADVSAKPLMFGARGELRADPGPLAIVRPVEFMED